MNKPVMTEAKEVSSNVEYAGTRNQVRKIMKAMRVKQNSIKINGLIVIKRGRDKFEYGEWMGDFHTGTLEDVARAIS